MSCPSIAEVNTRKSKSAHFNFSFGDKEIRQNFVQFPSDSLLVPFVFWLENPTWITSMHYSEEEENHTFINLKIVYGELDAFSA